MWEELVWLNEKTGLIDNIPEVPARGSVVILQEKITRKRSQIRDSVYLLKKTSYTKKIKK